MGLCFRRCLNNGAELSVWEIVESEQQLLDICSIPNDEMDELLLTKSGARRRERLAVRALVNELFQEKVYLGHHDNGRPFLQNSIIEISISHTSKYVAVITHPEESVGLDIESINRDFSSVEKRVLSDSEKDFLSDKERDKNLQLAIIWSAKEAIYKRMSQNGVDFASQIVIDKFSPKESGELDATFINRDGVEQEFELNYEILNEHIMVWLVG